MMPRTGLLMHLVVNDEEMLAFPELTYVQPCFQVGHGSSADTLQGVRQILVRNPAEKPEFRALA